MIEYLLLLTAVLAIVSRTLVKKFSGKRKRPDGPQPGPPRKFFKCTHEIEPYVFTGTLKYCDGLVSNYFASERLFARINELDSKLMIALDLKYSFAPADGYDKTTLINICFDSRYCYSFYVYHMSCLPELLMEIFYNTKVYLVGYNIEYQIRKLSREFTEFEDDRILPNCIDIEDYANAIEPRKRKWGVARLAEYFLGLRIFEDYDVKWGDWRADTVHDLTQDQLTLIASDVTILLKLYNHLRGIELGLLLESAEII